MRRRRSLSIARPARREAAARAEQVTHGLVKQLERHVVPVDAVIEPHETRPWLIRALEFVADKRDRNPPKKHGNIPL